MAFNKSKLIVLLTSFGVAGGAAVGCGPSAPLLDGFFAGGLGGYVCPPASVGASNCSDPDCGVACVADTICDPAQPDCPLGYECDATGDSAYCMPAKTCESSAGCGGDYCAAGSYSKGICAPADLTKLQAKCGSDNPCDWPFECRAGGCALFCTDAECPTGSACVENRCSPMPG